MTEKQRPTFSIITVTYNAGKVLEPTIRSVVEQTYPQVEYIIVDGASKDNTLAVVEKYRAGVTTLVSEPDRGLYDAMNKGLRLATGHYVCFLNAGDRLYAPTTLEQMVCSIPAGEQPDVIYGETALIDGMGNFMRMRRLSTPEVLNWKSFRQGMVVCHQAFFAKRELTPPYDLSYRFSSDFDWCIRVMKQSHLLHNTHLTLINYLSEGMTTQNRKASLMERFRIMSVHYGFWSTLLRHVGFVFRLVTKPGQ